MFGGLSRQFAVGRDDTTPRTLLVTPECATLSGITIGGDGCPTNAKLFGHILAKVANEWLPESDGDSVQVALSSTCLQHAVALCKSHIASQLDINVPVFCIAKQFALSGHSQAAEAAAFHFVDSRLEWIKSLCFHFCVLFSLFALPTCLSGVRAARLAAERRPRQARQRCDQVVQREPALQPPQAPGAPGPPATPISE